LPILKIFAENYRDLVQVGGSPYLGFQGTFIMNLLTF
jgi:hypothetical protein